MMTHSKHNTSTGKRASNSATYLNIIIDQSSQFNYLTNSTSPQIPSDLPNLRDACKIKDVNQVMIIIKQRSDLINEVSEYNMIQNIPPSSFNSLRICC